MVFCSDGGETKSVAFISASSRIKLDQYRDRLLEIGIDVRDSSYECKKRNVAYVPTSREINVSIHKKRE